MSKRSSGFLLPVCTQVVSGHYFSADGHRWHASTVAPFGNTVELLAGAKEEQDQEQQQQQQQQLFSTLERPKLLLDQDGNPTHLSNGACTEASCGGPCANCKYDCMDFTNVSPLDMHVPKAI
jgi:hypothetical protein